MSQRSEEVFSKLSDYGYSKEVATAIWQWYHPSNKAVPIF